MDTDRRPIIRMRGISKRFGPVRVLNNVDFEVLPGEVHILAGENGAGKSTLMKILGGVYNDYEGEIEINGQPARPTSPTASSALGTAVIYQELSLVGAMTVADNIFLGRTLRGRAGFVSDAEQRRRARRLIEQLGLNIDVNQNVEQLPLASQQMIEIVKAIAQDARLIVMDEPTSALSTPEVARLFTLIASLKARGCGIVYITHKMEEIEQIADRVTVLRDGNYIGTAPIAALPIPKLIEWMVGRKVEDQFERQAVARDEIRLRVENFSVFDPRKHWRRVVHEVSFQARAGEIIGIGGLQGSGASELFWGLFGAYGVRGRSGGATLDGRPLSMRSPARSIDEGVALLTNDRKGSGLVLSMSVTANSTLAALPRIARRGWRKPGDERRLTDEFARSLCLRAASFEMDVRELSGGNQQKVAIAKWLATEPRVLLLDEPTRGIDIGAKRDIYELMNQCTARGITILLITSELPELLALSDRILVLHRGQMTAEFTRAQASAERVLEAAMGRQLEAA